MDTNITKQRKFNWKYYINYFVIVGAMLLFVILSTAGIVPNSTLALLEEILMNIILAVSLSLVVGFLGELSLGHAGFMCLGAYYGGLVSMLLDRADLVEGNSILSFLIALVVGAVVAGNFGFLIGLPALRLRGDYLAIVTLAFCEIIKTLLTNFTFKLDGEEYGGPIGIKTPKLPKTTLYIVGFVILLITLAVIQNLIRSKHGRAITAIRDNEIAARATGINVTKYKLMAFIVSAVFAGVAGVLYSFKYSTVSASGFDYNYSIEILIMVVLGGMGNISGAMISATLITFINVKLQTLLTGPYAILKDVIYAIILVLIVIYNNAPKLKGFREKYNLKALFAKITSKKKRRGYADDDGAWHRVPTKIEMNEVLSTDFIVNESVKNPDKEDKS